MPPELEHLSPEEREQLAHEIAEMQQRLLTTPAAEIVAGHLVQLHQVALLHLAQEEPQFAEAAVLIDALAAIVDKLGGRMGENADPLHQAVSQLQMVFVERRQQVEQGDDAGVGEGAGAGEGAGGGTAAESEPKAPDDGANPWA